MKNNILIIAVIFCSLLSGYIGANFHALYSSDIAQENISMGTLESSIEAIATESSQSVVSIIVKKDMTIYRSDPWGFFHSPVGSIRQKIGGGSGFFIRKDGVILTNKHVVVDPNAEYTILLSNGEEYDGEVIAYVVESDLAVVKIGDNSKDFPAIKIKNSQDTVKIGSFVIAIGNALSEFQNSVSLGIISGTNRMLRTQEEELSGLLQTDAAINPGNSGGPLINLFGEVIGVNTAIAAGANGVGFAIEVNKELIDSLLREL